MTTLELVNAINERDLNAFVAKTPSRSGKPKTNVSVLGEDGKRYWLNRTSVGQNPDGTRKYAWALGNAMQPRA